MTDPDARTIIERLARHLATQASSPEDWRDRIDEAAGILAVIKLPDETMRESGDAEAWTRMIDAALVARWELGPSPMPPPPPGGTDEEGEVPFPPSADLEPDTESWVQIRNKPA
jgi:hypothetical protein